MNSKNQSITTDKAPSPIGPCSPAVQCGDFIFLSGQIPFDPETGTVAGNTAAEQTRQVLSNIRAILDSRELGMHALVKTTVFLRDISRFQEFNKVYENGMQGWKPARSVVEFSKLPRDVLVEIEANACR